MSRPVYNSAAPRTISELISDEFSPTFCREGGEFTAPADMELEVGTPIAVVSGSPVLFNPAGTDGSEVIDGFCLTSVYLRSGDTESIAWIANGPVRVVESRIAWPDGITQAQIDAALPALRAKNIKFITGVGKIN